MDERNKQISIPLKGINRAGLYGNSGELEQCVNARYRDGAIRPVAPAKLKYSLITYATMDNSTFDRVYVHNLPTGGENWIGLSHKYNGDGVVRDLVIQFTPSTGALGNIVKLFAVNTVTGIKFLNNYMIVLTAEGMFSFLYQDGTYKQMNVHHNIEVDIVPSSGTLAETDVLSHAYSYTDNDYSAEEEMRGFIYRKLAEESSEGRIAGAINYVAAFKLNDGSFILHTRPKIIQYVAESPVGAENRSSLDFRTFNESGSIKTKFFTYSPAITIDPTSFTGLEDEESVIQSLCIFFSKPILKYDIERTITNEYLNISSGDFNTFAQENAITEDWNNLVSPVLGWFNVCEVPFKSIIESTDASMDLSEYLSIKNFYQNYATKQALTVDQYSHHSFKASDVFIFNSRLWCMGADKILAAPTAPTSAETTIENVNSSIIPHEAYDVNLACMLVYDLRVDNQTKKVVSTTFTVTAKKESDRYYIAMPPLSYPDSRAKFVELWIYVSGVWKQVCRKSMKESTTHNLAYYYDDSLTTNIFQQYQRWIASNVGALMPIADANSFTVSNIDEAQGNQIQLSQTNNPFVFPSVLNYTVGTGTVRYLSVQSDALSEGQYGQFPVMAFTSEGVYALELGSGEVIIQAVKPVNSDVAISEPCSTNMAIFYAANGTIKALQGRKPEDIGRPLQGMLSRVISDLQYAHWANNASTIQLNTILTNPGTFDDYIDSTIIIGRDCGTSPDNERIVVSKPGDGYSFCFAFDTKVWYTISEGYEYYIQGYNYLLGRSQRGIAELSDLDNVQSVQIHLLTKPFNLTISARKKLEQTVLRCALKTKTSTYGVFALWASLDGNRWQIITGNDRRSGEINDIQLTHTFASYKYFQFAFYADLNQSFPNIIETIDIEVKPRYQHRLRS